MHIIYQLGHKHSNADNTLSRSPLPPGVETPPVYIYDVSSLAITDMLLEQRKDPWLASLIDLLIHPLSCPVSREIRRQGFAIPSQLSFRRTAMALVNSPSSMLRHMHHLPR